MNIITSTWVQIPLSDANREILARHHLPTNRFAFQNGQRVFEFSRRYFVSDPGDNLLAILKSKDYTRTKQTSYEWQSKSVTMNYTIEEDCMCLPCFAERCEPTVQTIKYRGLPADGTLEYDEPYIVDASGELVTEVTDTMINEYNKDYENASHSHGSGLFG